MADDDFEVDEHAGYKAPKEESLSSMVAKDSDDEALTKWKQSLLAGSSTAAGGDSRRVIVEKIGIRPVGDGPGDLTLDLTGDISKLKDTPIAIKEGSTYHTIVIFKVQHEMVSGLKYAQAVYRLMGGKPVKRVDKAQMMVGSYAPKAESQTFKGPLEEAPKGMIVRGEYLVKSQFFDDDGREYLTWEWKMVIGKDW